MSTLNNLNLSSGDQLLQSRLNNLLQTARSLSMPTQVELQSQIYSLLNAIIAQGNQVSRLVPLHGETPAVADDIYQNLSLLSQDALGISQQLLALEQDAAQLFNLAATTQNSLRQQVRKQVYTSTRQKYQENFIDNEVLDAAHTSASIDFGVGAAFLPLLTDQPAVPSTVVLGVNCDTGTLTGNLSDLLDGDLTTYVTWNGSLLELFFTFATPTILNRITIELNSYQGIYLNKLVSSPDGVLIEDLRAELQAEDLSLDGSSNKFSGDVTLDFDPRHVSQLRLVLEDQTGANQISLRNIYFSARTYDTTASVQTDPITFDSLGMVNFDAVSHQADQLTSITHQISYDGLSFQGLVPGQEIDLGATTCWYRAMLQRLDANFAQAASPINDPGADPATTGWFQINNIATLDMGNNILQRSIKINIQPQNPPSNDTRSLVLQETPLPNTLTVYQSNALLGPDVYQFNGNTLTFSSSEGMPNVLICYQTSALANAGLVARKGYYTPRLYQVSFRRTF